MDISQLNKPEIIYELNLRNAQFQPTQTAVELREILSNILAESHLYPPTSLSPYTLARDIEELKKCLDILDITITSYPNRKTKIIPYITHIRNRLSLIEINTESPPEDIQNYKSLWEQLKTHEQRFQILEPTPSTSVYHSATSVQETTVPNIFFDTLTQTLTNLSYNRPNTEIKKFSFSGDRCPREFILKVEEFATARNISNNTLYNHIYDVLSGIALDWFRANKDSIRDWEAFKTSLFKYFEITDYDYKLKKFIDSRKQKSNERVIIYFATMESLFHKLHEPLSEKQKIEILRRNLKPEFSQRLLPNDLSSVNTLLESCKWFENCQEVSNSDSNDLSHFLPTLSKQKSFSMSHSFDNSIHTRTYTPPTPIYTITPNKQQKYFSCPRCRTDEHKLEDCTSTKRVCFRCGKQNVIFTNCPKCNNNPPKN